MRWHRCYRWRTDSLQSPTEEVWLFFHKIQALKLDIQASEVDCRQMLEEEETLDLGLKRELEALNKQCGKLKREEDSLSAAACPLHWAA